MVRSYRKVCYVCEECGAEYNRELDATDCCSVSNNLDDPCSHLEQGIKILKEIKKLHSNLSVVEFSMKEALRLIRNK